MVNNTDILSAWQRIGWLEPSKTGYTGILDTDNKTTLSGLYFDEYPYANFIGVKDTYIDSAVSSAAINLFLKTWQQNAIIDVCKDVFGEDTLESGSFLEKDFDFDKTIENSGKFVFWKIIVPRGYVMTIKTVGLTLNGIVANLKIYVFNSSQLAALSSATTVTSVANSEKIAAMSYNLFGTSQTLKSGIYYVGYFQSDLGSVKAIQRDYYMLDSICSIEPALATPNGTSRPDYDQISLTGYTHGLNIDYVIQKDNTQHYLNNVTLFDQAIRMNVWCKVLNQYLLTQRYNATEISSKENNNDSKIFTELNGFRSDELYQPGMKKMYYKEIENVKKSFKKCSITTVTIQ
jgi:hypothetical protein